MKFTTLKVFLMTLLTALLAAAQVIASSVPSGDKDGPYLTFQVSHAGLTEVFRHIEKQTDFKFAFNDDIINSGQRFDLSYSAQRLEKILEDLSVLAEVKFKFVDKMISVAKVRRGNESVGNEKLADLLAVLPPAFPTNRLRTAGESTISGLVTDENNVPLPGVHVAELGTSNGTATDADGKFSITVQNQQSVLRFSFTGYLSQEIAAGAQKFISVALLPDIQTLKEVVITGYGDVAKLTYTGAAQSVAMDDIQMKGVADATQMLQGRSPGVNIQNVSGVFGAGPKITIRGGASILGDGAPLWVIDGVVQEDLVSLSVNDLVSGNANTLIGSSIAGLNPNDIESFEILKDAAATAIYGSRSLNGVVVIKTKQGKRSTPLSVSVSSEYTVRDLPNYSNADILDSKENFGILKELEDKGLLDITTISQGQNSGVYGIMANRINTFDPIAGRFLLENTPDARNRFLQKYERANTEWFNALFRSSAAQNHTLNFSGGGNNNQFYSSLGLYKDAGWTIADKVDRVTASLRNTFYLKKSAQLTLSMLGSYRQQRVPGSFNRTSDGVYGTVRRDFDINPYSYALNTSRTLRPYDDEGNYEYYTHNWAPFNILNETQNNYINIRVQDIKLQADYQMPLIKDKLQYAFVGAVRFANSAREHNMTENSNVAGAYRADENTVIRDANTFLWEAPDHPTRPPVSVLPEGGLYLRNNNFLRNFYLRNSLTYKNIFRNRHSLDAFIGQEIRYIDREESRFDGYGLNYGSGLIVNTDPRIISKIIGQSQTYFGLENTRERTASFFSRVTYGFDGKYIFSFTGNMNASNTQGLKNNRLQWTPTYTVGAKWNLKEEAFLQNNNWVNTLSLRAAYGLTAIAGTASNVLPIFRSLITRSRRDVSSRETGITIADLQNNDLTYEKQYETNIGLDLGVLKNRVNFTVDAYRRNGFDLFDNVRTSGLGGQDVKLINNADMTTRGIEMSLRTANIKSGSFEWVSTLNFSAFKQRITKVENKPNLLNATDDTGASFAEFPRNSIFSIQYAGLSDQGLPSYIIPDADKIFGVNFQDTGAGITPKPGERGGILSYLKYEGPSDAYKTISLQNTFTYKNWSLGCFIIASGGNKIRLPALFSDGKFDDVGAYSKDFLNRWILPGDEKLTRFPAIPSPRLMQIYEGTKIARAYNAYNFSTERTADGDYIRMRTVFLKYAFPKELLQRLFIKNLTLSGQIQNPWLIYSDSRLNGVDPDFYNSGGVAQPITRQYTMTLNVGF